MVDVSITVTVPESILNDAQFRAEIERTMRSVTGPYLKREFDKTTEGWDNRPTFTQKFSSSNDAISVKVFTTQEQYGIVNAGSPSHTITPRRGGMLRFQTGYRAATRPRVISSRAKARFGPTVSARSVRHPGFEARDFDVTIADDLRPRFEEDVNRAIERAAART